MNPVFDETREHLKSLPAEKRAAIKDLFVKRILLARYGPRPTKTETVISEKLKDAATLLG